jgi:hypothetical protein
MQTNDIHKIQIHVSSWNSTKVREATKTRTPALSPNSPFLYSPYLSPPLAMSTKKETNPAEVEMKDPAAR